MEQREKWKMGKWENRKICFDDLTKRKMGKRENGKK